MPPPVNRGVGPPVLAPLPDGRTLGTAARRSEVRGRWSRVASTGSAAAAGRRGMRVVVSVLLLYVA